MASVYELAQFSCSVYNAGSDKASSIVPGWSRGVPVGPGNPKSGFYAEIFLHMSRAEAVLSYRGTDDLADVYADAQLALAFVPNQLPAAEKALEQVQAKFGTRALYLTGHSLGGGLASMVGAKHGLPLVTFNAPGMRNSFVSDKAGLSPIALGLAASGSGMGGFAGVNTYNPYLHESINDRITADKKTKEIDTKHMLHIRASNDVVSVGTGAAIGPVESIVLPPWRPKLSLADLKMLLMPLSATVKLIKLVGVDYIIYQHSIDVVVSQIGKMPKFKGELGWAKVKAAAPVAVLNAPKIHTVARGESLSVIAKRYYGDPMKWKTIYERPRNKALIGADPNVIKPGIQIEIP